jgi:hypothetical protein
MQPTEKERERDLTNLKVSSDVHRAIKIHSATSGLDMYLLVEAAWHCYAACGYQLNPAGATLSEADLSEVACDSRLSMFRRLLEREKAGTLNHDEEYALKCIALALEYIGFRQIPS